MRRFLIFICLMLAIYQAVNAVRTSSLPSNISLSPPIELVAGGLWALAFGWVTIRLIRRVKNSVRVAWLTLAAFSAYSAVRLFIFARADYDRNRLPFLFLLMGLIIIITLFAAVRSAASNPRRRVPDRAENGAKSL